MIRHGNPVWRELRSRPGKFSQPAGQRTTSTSCLAAEARAEADLATLANVLERCLRAEAAWTIMAERAERTERLRQAHEVAKAHEAAKLAAAAIPAEAEAVAAK